MTNAPPFTIARPRTAVRRPFLICKLFSSHFLRRAYDLESRTGCRWKRNSLERWREPEDIYNEDTRQEMVEDDEIIFSDGPLSPDAPHNGYHCNTPNDHF